MDCSVRVIRNFFLNYKVQGQAPKRMKHSRLRTFRHCRWILFANQIIFLIHGVYYLNKKPDAFLRTPIINFIIFNKQLLTAAKPDRFIWCKIKTDVPSPNCAQWQFYNALYYSSDILFFSVKFKQNQLYLYTKQTAARKSTFRGIINHILTCLMFLRHLSLQFKIFILRTRIQDWKQIYCSLAIIIIIYCY